MKAVMIARQGQPVAENIQVVDDADLPSPAKGEVLIRTKAASLNHLDLWVGRGLPGVELEYPRISGADGAGVVEAVGEGVDDSWVGRTVVLNAAVPSPRPPQPDALPTLHEIEMIGEHTSGTMAERFTAPASNIVDIGETDPAKAAAFALTHLTAWRMLHSRAGLAPGQWVLITGIGGGVALALLNIAVHFGCRAIVTSRHQQKLDRAAELGAHAGVLDTGDDWSKQVRSITSGRGVDICADSVGKAIHRSCIKSLARGGVFVTCGATTGHDPPTDLARIFWNQLSIVGSTMGDMNEFRQIIALLVAGKIEPVIDSTFTVDDAPDAFARLESSEQFGKIVLTF